MEKPRVIVEYYQFYRGVDRNSGSTADAFQSHQFHRGVDRNSGSTADAFQSPQASTGDTIVSRCADAFIKTKIRRLQDDICHEMIGLLWISET